MANMTFAQSVAEGRKQGGVSPQKARENYEKMTRQINQNAVQSTPQTLPVKQTTPSETQTSVFTKKTEKKPVQDDTQERMSYLRSMNLDEARASLADLEERLSVPNKARDAYGNNLSQINRFMPGSAAYQALVQQSEDLRQRKNQLQQDIADADYVQTYDRYSALKSAPDYSSHLERTGLEPWKTNPSVAWATQDEFDTLYYLRNTQGDQAAYDYMDFMSDIWNQRSGQEDARQISNVKNPVARALATGGYGLFAGLDQYASGVKQTVENVFGDGTRIPTSSFQYGSSGIRQGLGKAGKLGYDIVTTTSNMIPTITAAAMTGGAGAVTGAASMGASVYGNTYNQAIQQGYSQKQANSYALISAASETALQYILGGISKLGGVATNSVVQKSVQNIRSAAGRAAAELGLRMGGEFTEEYLQEVLDPVFRNMMLDENNKVQLVNEEAAYAGILGAISAGMFEGGSAIQTARGGSNVQTAVEEAQAPAVTDTAPAVEKPVRYTLPTKPEQTVLDKVKSEYRNTGVITNRAAESILADPQAMAELGIQPTGTKSQQRAAVKDAISAEVTPRAHGFPLVDRTSEEQTVPVEATTRETVPVKTKLVNAFDSLEKAFNSSARFEDVAPVLADLYSIISTTDDTSAAMQKAREVVSQIAADEVIYEKSPFATEQEKTAAIESASEALVNAIRSPGDGLLLSAQFFASGNSASGGGSWQERMRQQALAREQAAHEADNARLYDEAMSGDGAFMPSRASENSIRGMSSFDSLEDSIAGFDEQAQGYVSRTEAYNWQRANEMIRNLGYDGTFQSLMDHAVWGPDGVKAASSVIRHYEAEARTAQAEYNAESAKGPAADQETLRTIRARMDDAYEKVGSLKEKTKQILSVSGKQLEASAEFSSDPTATVAKTVSELLDKTNLPDDQKTEIATESRRLIGEISASIEPGETVSQVLSGSLSEYDTYQYSLVRYSTRKSDIKLRERIRSSLDSDTLAHLEQAEEREARSQERLIGIIKEIAKERRTNSFFRSDKMGNTLERELQHTSPEELELLASGLVVARVNDLVPTSLGKKVATITRTNMLCGSLTAITNVTSNTLFGGIIDPIASSSGTLIDMLLSMRTGTRTKTADRGYFSSEARRAMNSAVRMAYIQSALDVDLGLSDTYVSQDSVDGGRSLAKYFKIDGRSPTYRTFRMSGNPVARAFSTMEKWLQYSLNVTDSMAKGFTQGETLRGMQALEQKGKLRDSSSFSEQRDIARQEGLYRTYQDDNFLSDTILGLKRCVNIASQGAVRTVTLGRVTPSGDYGIGDVVAPFAKTPTNILNRMAAYTPPAAVKGIAQCIDVVIKGSNATVQEQRSAVESFGRGVTGTGIIAAFAYIALLGLIRSSDDEDDKDAAALNSSSGISGTQLNVSALHRLMNGESTDWEDGDTLVSLTRLEPISGLAAIGTAFADELSEGGAENFDWQAATLSGLDRTISEFMNMSMLQGISNIGDAYLYSDAESKSGKGVDAALSVAGTFASQLVPSLVRASATAEDDYYRDVYSADTGNWLLDTLTESKNTVFNSIPGLRRTLPVKLDNYGQSKEYTTNKAIQWLNSFVNPLYISTFKNDSVTAEIRSVGAATGNVTVYPARSAPNSFSYDGEKHTLSYDDKRQYQTTYGEVLHDTIADFMNNSTYQSMNAGEQAKVLAAAQEYASEYAKNEYLDGGYSSSILDDVSTLSEEGLDFADYYYWKNTLSSIKGDNRQASVISALKKSGMTQAQQSAVYFSIGGYSISDVKLSTAKANGISERKLKACKYEIDSLRINGASMYEQSNVLANDSSITDDQKTVIGSLLIYETTAFTEYANIDFTSEESRILSMLSDSAQARYELYASGTFTAQEWSEIYTKYSGYRNKDNMMAAMIADGYSQSSAETLYKWIKGNQIGDDYYTSQMSPSAYNQWVGNVGPAKVMSSKQWLTYTEKYSGKQYNDILSAMISDGWSQNNAEALASILSSM